MAHMHLLYSFTLQTSERKIKEENPWFFLKFLVGLWEDEKIDLEYYISTIQSIIKIEMEYCFIHSTY